jgi:predicted HNH restriction endonuclease
VCDIHHINGRDVENPDAMVNLTYLCPNCHRMAHRGLLEDIVSVDEQLLPEEEAYVNKLRRLGR